MRPSSDKETLTNEDHHCPSSRPPPPPPPSSAARSVVSFLTMDPTGPPPPNPRFGPIPPNPRGVTGAAAGGGHRRAYSETFLRLPDDLLFDSDPDFGISDIDFPSLSDESLSTGRGPLPVDSGRSDPLAVEQGRAERPAGGAHLRSLSVDAAFFENLVFQGAPAGGGGGSGSGGGVQDRRGLHRRSGSMDGVTYLLEGDSAAAAAAAADYAKKAMTPDKLADLALKDPKRAKRLDFFFFPSLYLLFFSLSVPKDFVKLEFWEFLLLNPD